MPSARADTERTAAGVRMRSAAASIARVRASVISTGLRPIVGRGECGLHGFAAEECPDR